MKLNGDIAKIWKHTCTFSSLIAWFLAAATFLDREICSQTFFRLPIFSFSIRVPSPSLLCLSSRRSSHACFLYASLFSPYIRISLSNSICSRESTFLSSISLPFFKNQNAPLLSCRIFSFHLYAATLIPFSSQNISLTFFSAHTLVRVEWQPLFSYQTIKKQK